ncbi:hypothetical protein HDZ31DRAFT_33145 [Schizophyllum fasciatum]
MTAYLSTNLCLACSSSLPPKVSESVFLTTCCRRPICPTCLASNPRLARYSPCLACLSGVGVVGNSSTSARSSALTGAVNIDGGLKDEDAFVLGSDDDEDGDEADPPPAYDQVDAIQPSEPSSVKRSTPSEMSPAAHESIHGKESAPLKYYIKRGDTLQGISFKFAVDGRELCKLNTLPPSTLSTTPHLLHTRSFLVLPPSARDKLSAAQTPQEAAEEEARRARQRAEKRLQTLTKEADWRVARAYIALADGDDAERDAKAKEMGAGPSSGSCAGCSRLERYAVEQYLEDDDWEASERRAGRAPSLLPLPSSSSAAPSTGRRWW